MNVIDVREEDFLIMALPWVSILYFTSSCNLPLIHNTVQYV